MRFARWRKPYFIKMLSSYLLIVAVIVAGLCSAFLFFIYRAKKDEIDILSKNALLRTSNTADILYEQVWQVGIAMLSDPNISTFLSKSSTTTVERYNAYLNLTRLSAIYPFIQSVTICNTNDEKYLSSVYGNSLESFEDVTSVFVDRINKNDYFTPVKMPTTHRINNIQYVNTLAFFIYPQNISRNGYALVICVNESYLRNLIFESSQLAHGRVLVINSAGYVISDTDNELFIEKIENESLLSQIFNDQAPTGRFVDNIQNKKTAVTFVKTNLLDWTFISLSNYQVDQAPLQYMLNTLMLISVLLLSVGIIGSIYATRRMYLPMNDVFHVLDKVRIVNQNEMPRTVQNEYKIIEDSLLQLSEYSGELESKLEKNTLILRAAQLRTLLEGPAYEPIEDFPSLEKQYHRVIKLRIDQKQKFNLQQDDDCLIWLYAICNILGDLTAKYGLITYYVDGEKNAFVLFSTDEEISYVQLTDILTSTQNHFTLMFGQSFSCSIGKTVALVAEIYHSYIMADELYKNHFVIGNASIIHNENIHDLLDGKKQIPENLRDHIIYSLNSLKVPEKELDILFDCISDKPYNECVIELRSVIYTIQQHFEQACSEIMRFNNLSMLLVDIARFESLKNVQIALHTLCKRIVEQNFERTNTKNDLIVDDIKNYIQEHYTDPGLSMDSIAKAFGFSAGYIRKLFKNAIGVGIPEYVTGIRLAAAKKLLLETEKTALVISEEIGLYNHTYFTTLFKKRFGMTPIYFRQMELSRKSLENKNDS